MTHTPIASFDKLPDSAFVRESDLVRSAKRPQAPALLPFSGQTLWRLVRQGRFPAPLKLSANVTAWRVGNVRKWLQEQEKSTGADDAGAEGGEGEEGEDGDDGDEDGDAEPP